MSEGWNATQRETEILQLLAERNAADEVAKTARLYVAAMEEKLATVVRLLDGLLGLELGSGQAALAFVERYRADVSSQKEPS